MMTHRIARTALALTWISALLGVLAILAAPPASGQVEQHVEPLQGPEMITFRSQVLGEERSVLVRLPDGYENSSRRYPVLYVLDAEYFFQQAASAVQFHSELGYEGGQHRIPEMIVVGVVNVDRDRDFTPTHAPEQSQGRLSFPTSGGAEAFLEFFENELFSLVESRYRTLPHRVLSGWSLGGLLAVHVYLERPSLFSRYLAISPSLWWDDSVAVKETRRRLRNGGALSPKRLVITLGTLEGGDMDGAVRRNFVPLLASQRQPALDFAFVEIPDEDHGHVPYKAYFDGLRALYSDWLLPSEVLQEGSTAVDRFFEDLSARWECRVDVPLSVYRTLSTTLPTIEPALEVARLAVARYPHSSVAYFSLGRLQQIEGDSAAAVASFEKALQLELERPVPQSERLRAIRGRLQRLQARDRD
jgi:predicted alpha/beta superfamily hydrolase